MKTYIVGNWKMHFTVGESSVYFHKLLHKLPSRRGIEIAVAPSTLALQPLSLQAARQHQKIRLAAQNLCGKDFGAYTGETSAAQLSSLVDYAIIGHSERRHIFGETNRDIREKVAAALRNKITPILCIGETADERNFGETADVIRDQLLGGLADVAVEDLRKVIVAYEPVWAISSTGNSKFATPDEVHASFALIRDTLAATYGAKFVQDLPILYGGSVSPVNAAAYLALPEVNGLLVGKASLTLSQFSDIIEIAKRVKS